MIMPHEPVICGHGERVSCLLGSNHLGDHLSENTHGRFFVWAFDEEYCGDIEKCQCLADADESPIECFNWSEIPKEEADKILKKTSAKS